MTVRGGNDKQKCDEGAMFMSCVMMCLVIVMTKYDDTLCYSCVKNSK